MIFAVLRRYLLKRKRQFDQPEISALPAEPIVKLAALGGTVEVHFPNASIPPNTRFRRSVREYVQVRLVLRDGAHALGEIQWANFAARLLHWLDGGDCPAVPQEPGWCVLLNLAPMGNTWHGTVGEPRKIRIYSRSSNPVAELQLTPEQAHSWRESLNAPCPVSVT